LFSLTIIMMDDAIVLRDLTVADLPQVTNVHLAAFSTAALTQLGAEAVRRYYLWQMTGPHDALALGAFEGVELAGFNFCGIFRGAMGGFLHKERGFLIGQILTHPGLIWNPLVRGRLRSGFYSAFWRKKRPARGAPAPAKDFCILSIAVHPSFQGRGVGRRLMEQAEVAALARGYRYMTLSVHADNLPAISFYEGLGWQKLFKPSGWDGGMIKHFETPGS
jgi:ribosomal protein S18 acetylase RimI-like enzyme